jgi:hypothetical protein
MTETEHFHDWHFHEFEQRFSTVVRMAYDAMPEAEKQRRQALIDRGDYPAGCYIPFGDDGSFALDPETGGLVVWWADDVLVIIDKAILEPGSGSPAQAN